MVVMRMDYSEDPTMDYGEDRSLFRILMGSKASRAGSEWFEDSYKENYFFGFRKSSGIQWYCIGGFIEGLWAPLVLYWRVSRRFVG
jgi:hypothetical protein